MKFDAWETDLTTIDKFLKRMDQLIKSGVPDTRTNRRNLWYIFVHNKEARKLTEKGFVEFIKKKVKKNGKILYVKGKDETEKRRG